MSLLFSFSLHKTNLLDIFSFIIFSNFRDLAWRRFLSSRSLWINFWPIIQYYRICFSELWFYSYWASHSKVFTLLYWWSMQGFHSFYARCNNILAVNWHAIPRKERLQWRYSYNKCDSSYVRSRPIQQTLKRNSEREQWPVIKDLTLKNSSFGPIGQLLTVETRTHLHMPAYNFCLRSNCPHPCR